MLGSWNTMSIARTKGAGATAKPRWRPFGEASLSRRKRRSMREPTDTDGLSDTVRSSIDFYRKWRGRSSAVLEIIVFFAVPFQISV